MYSKKDEFCKRKLTYNQIRTKNSARNGYRPCVVFPSGTKYVGNWLESKKENYGLIVKNNGYYYMGEWKENKRHGYGILGKTLPSQKKIKIYVGEWKDNMRSGDGKQYYKNGIYFGQWADDKRSGHGIMWFADRTAYFGQWQSDRFHGIGVIYFTNLNCYEGTFCKGMKHGEGVFYHNNTGQIQKGIWYFGNCKESIMIDARRHQVLNPTWYPITRNFCRDVSLSLQKYASEHFPKLLINNDKDLLIQLCEEYYDNTDERCSNDS